MPVSANYITLQRAVADELGDRIDLLGELADSGLASSPVKRAIQSAIAKYERESFWFNEDYAQPLFTTVVGQELYTVGAGASQFTASPNVWMLHILIGANRYEMKCRSWMELERESPNPAHRGQPGEWAYFAQKIRLYPIPDGAYPVRASRTSIAAALSADADSNVWTNEAYDLIRSEAKLILARDTLYDPQIVLAATMAIHGDPTRPHDKGYLGALKAETMRRARSRIRPTQF